MKPKIICIFCFIIFNVLPLSLSINVTTNSIENIFHNFTEEKFIVIPKLNVIRSFPVFKLNIKLKLKDVILDGFDNAEIKCQNETENKSCIIFVSHLGVSCNFDLNYMKQHQLNHHEGSLFSLLSNVQLHINNIEEKEIKSFITMEQATFDVKLKKYDQGQLISDYLTKHFVRLLNNHMDVIGPIFSKEINNLLEKSHAV